MLIGNELNTLFFVMCALAAFRVATLFSADFGPLHCFWYFREFFKKRSKSVGEHVHDEFWTTATLKQRIWRSLWELVDCQYCCGLWAAIVLVTVAPLWMVAILAAAGLQSLVHRVVRVLQSYNDMLEQSREIAAEALKLARGGK